tara:strand:- start:26424 stop:26732 length:309 start_codon:yes stop_codon:yes gene_type:complete
MIDHVAIQVKSIDESVGWYTSRFGGKILHQDKTWAMIDLGNVKLALTIASQHPPHIAITVDSISGFPGPLGKISTHRDGSLFMYEEDPAGNTVEYIHYPDQT